MTGGIDYRVLFEIMILLEIEQSDKLEIFENIQIIESVRLQFQDNKNSINFEKNSHQNIKNKVDNNGIKL